MTSTASLLLAHRPEQRTLLVIGEGKLVHTRMCAAREAGLNAKHVWHTPLAEAPPDQFYSVSHASLFPPPGEGDACKDAWGRLLDEIDGEDKRLFAVCVTDTLTTLPNDVDARRLRCQMLAQACRARRLPINVTDIPDLCDFSFPATHRFIAQDADHPSSLQIAVTTNGRGCRLAGRIRRHVVSSLPASVGLAVERIGDMREMAKTRACRGVAGEHEDEPILTDTLGYVSTDSHDSCSAQRQRMRSVAQISEYWPLECLATLDATQMRALLEDEEARSDAPHPDERATKRSRHDIDVTPPTKKGRVYLLGSGPGHPALLTVAAKEVLMSPDTDLILSDKLVPTAVLALLPPSTPFVIAKKFPGNAEGAQSELITQALDAAREGKTVVRLKQGDPFVYGRGGEELVACQNAGIDCTVIPGISSALAGPLMFNIPVTQRGAAESMIMCTGVGRGGKRVMLPGYERSRTLLLLMGVARLPTVIETLVSESSEGRHGAAYPPYTPIAIIERASSNDQRMIASTLERIAHVMDMHVSDGQRPPAMMVVGWAVLSLAMETPGARVLDDEAECCASPASLAERDASRIAQWLGPRGHVIREGLPSGYDRFLQASLPDNALHGPRSESGWAPPRYQDPRS